MDHFTTNYLQTTIDSSVLAAGAHVILLNRAFDEYINTTNAAADAAAAADAEYDAVITDYGDHYIVNFVPGLAIAVIGVVYCN